jgi:glycosyltransferase 2 family protein
MTSFLHTTLNCNRLTRPAQYLVVGVSRKVGSTPRQSAQVMTKYRKYLEFLAMLLLAAAIIWWFGRRLDWQQVKIAVERSDWRLIALAAVIILLAYLWRAIRWQALLLPFTRTSLREVWIATCVGFAAVLTIGRAGEIVRPVVLPMRDPRVRPAASIVTIMIERLYDIMTVVVLFGVNLFWLKPVNGGDFGPARIVGLVILSFGALAILLLVIFKLRSATVIDWIDRKVKDGIGLRKRIKRALVSTLEQLATALTVLSDIKLLATTIGWSLALWFSVLIANLLICRAFGLSFGLSHVLFILGWSMIGSAIPTPGGAAGAFHAATAGALILLGVARDEAAAISIVLHLIDFAPAALFGLFYFLRGDVNFARLRRMLSAEAVEHAVEDEQIVLARST